MKRELRERRDKAAERHDAALARWPSREGAAFDTELQSIANDLKALAHEADDPASDPAEVARTYAWLGDAYYDLGRGRNEALLGEGAASYQRSEELLADVEAPVQKAKLDFNYGNTLRGLSGGFDVALLEAAETRYERAAQAFREHRLPDLVATVVQQQKTLRPQLRLARKNAELQRGVQQMQALKEDVADAGPVDRERIATQLARVRATLGRGQPEEALEETLAGVHEQAQAHPERCAEAAGRLEALQGEVAAVGEMLKEARVSSAPTVAAGSSGTEGWEQDVLTGLKDRLQSEAGAGKVSGNRAAQLRELVQEFSGALAEGGDDLESMARRAHAMRAVMKKAMDPALSPSWATPAAPAGSRAERAGAVLSPLKRFLMAEKGRAMLPAEESSAGTSLLARLFSLESRIREAGEDETRIAGFEDELWRLALDIQEHARRYHLTLARPIFSSAAPHANPRSLFLSGDETLAAAARELGRREGIQVLDEVGRGDLAQERWNQLRAASVAAFDVGVAAGPARAQVCYELGLALALGKSSVIVSRRGVRLPFNIALRPVTFSGDLNDDSGALGQGVCDALGSVVWGGSEGTFEDAPAGALGWLDRHAQGRLTDGSLRIAFSEARRHQDDATAFRRSLEQLLGMLGSGAPALLFPAWPPAYPSLDGLSRCFHVMPFRPSWASLARDRVRGICRGNRWHYTRGDEAEAQRVIHGIWSEIARASAVVVDVSGHNPNVALELGLVHALGRPYRVVAQGPPGKHMFPSLEKVQVHRYGPAPGFDRLDDIIRRFLEGTSAAS